MASLIFRNVDCNTPSFAHSFLVAFQPETRSVYQYGLVTLAGIADNDTRTLQINAHPHIISDNFLKKRNIMQIDISSSPSSMKFPSSLPASSTKNKRKRSGFNQNSEARTAFPFSSSSSTSSSTSLSLSSATSSTSAYSSCSSGTASARIESLARPSLNLQLPRSISPLSSPFQHLQLQRNTAPQSHRKAINLTQARKELDAAIGAEDLARVRHYLTTYGPRKGFLTYNFFLTAVDKGNGEIVDLLLQYRTPLTPCTWEPNAYNNAVMQAACRKGDAVLVGKLIQGGGTIDSVCANHVFDNPSPALVELLIENIPYDHLNTLQTAELFDSMIKKGSLGHLRKLYDQICQSENCSTIFHENVVKEYALIVTAAETGEVDKMEFCHQLGQSWTMRNAYRDTPLSMAAAEGHENAVSYLLGKSDPGINLRFGPNNRTALLVAASNNCQPVVELLIKAGADIQAKDKSGDTALSLAAGENNKNILKLLISNKAVQPIRDYEERVIPIFESVRHTDLEAFELLLAAGADVNVHDVDGNNILHYAYQNASDPNKSTDRLVALGVSLDETNNKGQTPANTLATPAHAPHLDSDSEEEEESHIYVAQTPAHKIAPDDSKSSAEDDDIL